MQNILVTIRVKLSIKDFAMLSKDINDFVQTFGTKIISGLLPMYDEGKSGYWISETKIKIHTLAPKCLLVDPNFK
jgi:hypothetical protein